MHSHLPTMNSPWTMRLVHVWRQKKSQWNERRVLQSSTHRIKRAFKSGLAPAFAWPGWFSKDLTIKSKSIFAPQNPALATVAATLNCETAPRRLKPSYLGQWVRWYLRVGQATVELQTAGGRLQWTATSVFTCGLIESWHQILLFLLLDLFCIFFYKGPRRKFDSWFLCNAILTS